MSNRIAMVLSLCTLCGKQTLMRCCVCKSAWYCSVKCLNADLPLHKVLCQKYVDFLRDNPRPEVEAEERPDTTTSYQLAIHLPVDKTEPEFFWIFCQIVTTFDDSGKLLKVVSGVTSDRLDKLNVTLPTTKNGRRIDVLVQDIKATRRTTKLKPNLTFEVLNQGYEGSDWSGNLVVTSVEPKTREGNDYCIYRDVNLEDWRSAYNAMAQTNNLLDLSSGNENFIRDDASWTRGARVNCALEVERRFGQNVAKQYQSVLLRHTSWDDNTLDDIGLDELPENDSSHPVFKSNEISPISQELGMPLQLLRTACWTGDVCPGIGRAGAIFGEIDPKSETFSKVPCIKSYVAVRKDKKDLTLCQFNVLLSFSFDAILQLTKSWPGCQRVRRQAVAELFHTSLFEEFFRAYRSDEVTMGRLFWKNEKPPARQNKYLKYRKRMMIRN